MLGFLPACAPLPPRLVETRVTVRDPLPLVWVSPTPAPEWPDRLTNGELLDLARRLASGLNSCNDDKADLVRWQQALPPIPPETVTPAQPATPKRWWQR